MADYYGLNRTVVHVLRDQVSKNPERTWITTEDYKYSVLEMDKRSSIVARNLSRIGVSPSDTVLVMLPNGIEFIDCWLALAKLKAIQVPVNTAYFGAMLEHLIQDSGATRIIIHACYLEAVKGISANIGSQLETRSEERRVGKEYRTRGAANE